MLPLLKFYQLLFPRQPFLHVPEQFCSQTNIQEFIRVSRSPTIWYLNGTFILSRLGPVSPQGSRNERAAKQGNKTNPLVSTRVDVESDRRSQRGIYNQCDCLTPHNQRSYPYLRPRLSFQPFVRFAWTNAEEVLTFSSSASVLQVLSPLPLAEPHYPDHDSR